MSRAGANSNSHGLTAVRGGRHLVGAGVSVACPNHWRVVKGKSEQSAQASSLRVGRADGCQAPGHLLLTTRFPPRHFHVENFGGVVGQAITRPRRRTRLRPAPAPAWWFRLACRVGSRIFQDAAEHVSDLGAGRFADGPVDCGTLADAGDEFGGDDFEFVVAHCLHGALVHGQGVVEADFIFVQAEVFAALGGESPLGWRWLGCGRRSGSFAASR